jgi:DNA-binding YbaB/EbfC family protein
MNEMMRQAARMQRKIDETKAKLADREVTGAALGDKVKVTVSYAGKLTRVEVDPAFLAAEGIDIVLDGICAAANAGIAEADRAMDAEISKITGGAKLPGT